MPSLIASDIDMTINLVNFSSWAVLQEKLAALKINPDPFGHSICSDSFLKQELFKAFEGGFWEDYCWLTFISSYLKKEPPY